MLYSETGSAVKRYCIKPDTCCCIVICNQFEDGEDEFINVSSLMYFFRKEPSNFLDNFKEHARQFSKVICFRCDSFSHLSCKYCHTRLFSSNMSISLQSITRQHNEGTVKHSEKMK